MRESRVEDRFIRTFKRHNEKGEIHRCVVKRRLKDHSRVRGRGEAGGGGRAGGVDADAAARTGKGRAMVAIETRNFFLVKSLETSAPSVSHFSHKMSEHKDEAKTPVNAFNIDDVLNTGPPPDLLRRQLVFDSLAKIIDNNAYQSGLGRCKMPPPLLILTSYSFCNIVPSILFILPP